MILVSAIIFIFALIFIAQQQRTKSTANRLLIAVVMKLVYSRTVVFSLSRRNLNLNDFQLVELTCVSSGCIASKEVNLLGILLHKAVVLLF